eukprot:TRINITY_DN7831_c0_g1_i1.p1 TRINITY_DN7831_c0_g1~~TRINITY_DN7831_c0_g1_i1.p1  ORF type:complete len:279 (-),score=85.85 TRINITY_DN7831_c0_g1_i1:80-916(-)
MGKQSLLCIVLLCFVSALLAVNVPEKVQVNGWDRLVVTFGKWKGLPTTQKDAQDAGWTAFGTCAQGFPFNRYILGTDLGSLVLFDSLGNIAGYAVGTSNPSPYRPDVWKRETLNGQTFNTMTFYFQDPKTVCSRSEPVEDKLGFDSGVTGDRVWLSLPGNTSAPYLALPLTESQAQATPGFVKGGCFYTMGLHYWYNISSSQSCTEFFPLFTLFNRGLLNGFGAGQWGFNDPSPRFEHPSGSVIKLFFDGKTLPQCLLGSTPISTQHIYLTNPALDFC